MRKYLGPLPNFTCQQYFMATFVLPIASFWMSLLQTLYSSLITSLQLPMPATCLYFIFLIKPSIFCQPKLPNLAIIAFHPSRTCWSWTLTMSVIIYLKFSSHNHLLQHPPSLHLRGRSNARLVFFQNYKIIERSCNICWTICFQMFFVDFIAMRHKACEHWDRYSNCKKVLKMDIVQVKMALVGWFFYIQVWSKCSQVGNYNPFPCETKLVSQETFALSYVV